MAFSRKRKILATIIVDRLHSPARIFSTEENQLSEYGYRVIYEKLAEGGFQVIVPALLGIVTYGRTIEEAREMAQDAITCHLKGLLKDNEDIPEDPFTAENPITEELKIAV